MSARTALNLCATLVIVAFIVACLTMFFVWIFTGRDMSSVAWPVVIIGALTVAPAAGFLSNAAEVEGNATNG